MVSLKETATSLLAKVKALQETLAPDLSGIQKSSAAVTEAAQKIAASWSGSSMGYHSELYYSDFEPPPLGVEFSPEWGGIHGIPADWQKRLPDEVKERIEKLSGVRIAILETSTDDALRRAKALQSEIVTEISGLHLQPGLEQEKKLLTNLEKFTWGSTAHEYIDANLPKQFITRDSEAYYQGVRLSAHLHFAGIAFQKRSESVAVEEFFKAAARLLRQVELNVGPMGLCDGADQQPVKAVLAICDRFHAIAQQFVQRREGRPSLKIEDEYDV
jgi:hypothetical protein